LSFAKLKNENYRLLRIQIQSPLLPPFPERQNYRLLKSEAGKITWTRVSDPTWKVGKEQKKDE